ncbi:MAG: hypothetical protein FWF71_01400 [Actinomycetia bacterium]|nr:hypothetical protein [Actinomycetes bacterium]
MQDADGLLLNLRDAAELWVVPPAGRGVRQTRILSQRGEPGRPWLKLAGVNDRDAAFRITGRWLLASEADAGLGVDVAGSAPVSEGFDRAATPPQPLATPLPPRQLPRLGLPVIDCKLGHIGVLKELRSGFAQTLWVVDSELFGEVLVPAVDAYVLAVDDQKADVSLPRGLLELN